jgi:hypothetical protein
LKPSKSKKPDTAKCDLIHVAVRNLISSCGYDKRDAANDWFIELLENAVNQTRLTVKQAREDGALPDVGSVLAFELVRMAPSSVHEYQTLMREFGGPEFEGKSFGPAQRSDSGVGMPRLIRRGM